MALDPESLSTAPSPPTCAQAIVQALNVQGVTRLFCVAGESYLVLLDALVEVRDRMTVVTCRHEANAANMAEAMGKLTGRPGVVMVTRGPGALHASIALHTAQQDATPLVMLVGQIATTDVGRNAFQELNYEHVFGSICKAVLQADPARMGAIIEQAFAVAMDGRPGPVIVTLPEDLLELPATGSVGSRVSRSQPALVDADVQAIAKRLREAQKPLLWVGGSGWTDDGIGALKALAHRAQMAVVSGFRRKDLVDNRDPHYIGECGFSINAAVQTALNESDLILVIGAALGDIETGGYTRLQAKDTAQRVIHLAMDQADVGRVFPVSLGRAVDVNVASQQVLKACEAKQNPATARFLQDLKAQYQRTLALTEIAGSVHLGAVYLTLRERLPSNAVVCNGAGNYAAWLHRYFEHHEYRTQLAPQSGAMGYGLGAGVAAALAFPDRDVVVVAGDGCFTMASSDLVTAAGLPNLLILVVNNGIYGTIRMHQEARFPKRPIATDLQNPDFVELARAAGLQAFKVTETEQFPGVLDQALLRRPALIELITDPRDILPGKILDP